MTEEQKYQGALYKPKKAKTGNHNSSNATAQDNMAHRAYVEDVADYDYDAWQEAAQPPPRVPSPPQAEALNVFEFMVNPTPTASTVALPQATGPSDAEPSERTQLVRFEEPKPYDDLDADMMADDEALISYGAGPIPGGTMTYETPVPKSRDRKSKDGKKDKKRKRLHVETHDLEMTDAPVLHSGLTGGLNRMMSNRPHAFPPSPDYSGSGGELGETPASPLKKSKSSKHNRSSRHESGISNNLMSLITSGSTSKTTSKSKKRKSTATTSSKKRHSHHSSKRLEGAKEPKLLEYTGESGDRRRSGSGSGAMVVFGERRADVFFSLVNKGPESERGCSVNKALKRFHRERTSAGDALPKPLEEKELFRSLRMRRNEAGEIVLFSI